MARAQKVVTKKAVKKTAASVRKGTRMTRGKAWELTATKGDKRMFKGTLLGTHNLGQKRIAIFSVPKAF